MVINITNDTLHIKPMPNIVKVCIYYWLFGVLKCNGHTAGWVGCSWGVFGRGSVGHLALFADLLK